MRSGRCTHQNALIGLSLESVLNQVQGICRVFRGGDLIVQPDFTTERESAYICIGEHLLERVTLVKLL